MVLPVEQDPVFCTASPSHQEACTSLLSSSIRGQTEEARTTIPQLPEWKPQLLKAHKNDNMDHSNSMKLWATPCRATQDRWVMVESSDKMWVTGEGNGKLLQYACLENPRTVWRGKKICQRKMSTLDQFSSVTVVSNTLWPRGMQHTRLPCPSPTLGACSNSGSLSQWCHPTISSSVVPFSCLQSFPALGSFPVSWLFSSGGQSIGVSASVSVLPMNIQDWFPLGLTGLM